MLEQPNTIRSNTDHMLPLDVHDLMGMKYIINFNTTLLPMEKS